MILSIFYVLLSILTFLNPVSESAVNQCSVSFIVSLSLFSDPFNVLHLTILTFLNPWLIEKKSVESGDQDGSIDKFGQLDRPGDGREAQGLFQWENCSDARCCVKEQLIYDKSRPRQKGGKAACIEQFGGEVHPGRHESD